MKNKKVLIANRGEIAVRIIHALKELDMKTVAVYSEADKGALFTQIADECICIGASESIDSYLDPYRILSAALLKKWIRYILELDFFLKMIIFLNSAKNVELN